MKQPLYRVALCLLVLLVLGILLVLYLVLTDRYSIPLAPC